MRLAALVIPLIVLVVPLNSLNAKSPNYWDYFREPDTSRTSWYDIEFALSTAGPVSDELGDQLNPGLGFIFGFHYQIKFFRAGLELGLTYFPGKDSGDESANDGPRTDYFASVPVYCDLAFDIKCAQVFSLVPFISIGFSVDMLRFTPSPSSIFDTPRDETRIAIHQMHRLGLGFWFHLNRNYSLQITAAFMPLIEYGSRTTVAELIQLALGFTRRF